MLAEIKKPADNILEYSHIQTVNNSLTMTLIKYQTTVFQDIQVVAYGRLGHIKICGNLTGSPVFFLKKF